MIKKIILFILSAVLLAGCGQEKTAVSLPEQNTEESQSNNAEQTENSKEPESDNTAEETEVVDEEPEDKELNVGYRLSYDGVNLAVTSLIGDIHAPDYYVASGDLLNDKFSEEPDYNGFPEMNVQEEDINLSVDHSNAVRKIFIDFFNDNMDMDLVTEKYVELADKYVEGTDRLDITDIFPKIINFTVDGKRIEGILTECIMIETAHTGGKGSHGDFKIACKEEDDLYSYLSGVMLNIKVEIDDTGSLKRFFYDIAKEDKELTSVDTEDIVLDNIIAFKKPAEEKYGDYAEADEDTKADQSKSISDSSLIGTWYEEYSHRDTYIFRDNGTVVQFSDNGEAHLMFYSLENGTVYIWLPDEPKNYDFDFEFRPGCLISGLSGECYFKR